MGPDDPTLTGSTSKSYVILKLVWDGSDWITWKTQTLTPVAASHEPCAILLQVSALHYLARSQVLEGFWTVASA